MTKPSPNPAAPAATAARVRIASHVTQSRFLHVEDALSIGKLRIFAGNYRKGQGMEDQGYAHAFVDIADARVIFGALACGEQNFSHKEYKGTPPPLVLSKVEGMIKGLSAGCCPSPSRVRMCTSNSRPVRAN